MQISDAQPKEKAGRSALMMGVIRKKAVPVGTPGSKCSIMDFSGKCCSEFVIEVAYESFSGTRLIEILIVIFGLLCQKVFRV